MSTNPIITTITTSMISNIWLNSSGRSIRTTTITVVMVGVNI